MSLNKPDFVINVYFAIKKAFQLISYKVGRSVVWSMKGSEH